MNIFYNIIRRNAILMTALLPFALQSCGGSGTSGGGNTASSQSATTTTQPVAKQHFEIKIINLNPESTGKVGDEYSLDITDDGTVSADSTIIKVDGKKIATLPKGETSFRIATANIRCGRVPVSVQFCLPGGTSEYASQTLMLYSDIVPKKKSYKVLATYPHDVAAYTQGLVYEDGCFYESTGLTRKSSLRKVKIDNGSVLQSVNLEDEYFGEGLAMVGDKLMQLTWTSHKGFVYDKKTFERLSEFNVATEGWGLSALNKDTLILTSGSENLYFLEPNGFSNIKTIQVCDNLGVVQRLNETEIVNGRLLANIYQTDLIAEIDYNTGKVLSYIDLEGILPGNLRSSSTDVLNGIAYDAAGDRLFVTGKNWPKLYLIKIIDAK
ncbi:MAG: glutaminyl-peptide cyclotransferase [Bacteroidales bacterium]|nr:glutaminyl-peptide cyclotransferase [Bacteroidales bacterium]